MTIAEQLLRNDPASQMLGIQLVSIDEESCSVSMVVTDKMTNGYDVCHGGFIYTLADTASAFASSMEGETILSASNQIEYLAPAKLGDRLIAAAKVSFITGKNLFCDVKVTNQSHQVIALVRGKLISKNASKV
ncbi:hotdog fold thioesterase [Aliikangiella marina]|uniref:Hotdog fold thioesterase n=1 Tax=Aliikangiella marina TaxID=1712262 RepID=A0A545T2T9_9GAMM|nr:hotdog fold thioesterase [Aliikangiella marina]TQV71519.1 hotdog fold thioesterase [Aliikangiella marina]